MVTPREPHEEPLDGIPGATPPTSAAPGRVGGAPLSREEIGALHSAHATAVSRLLVGILGDRDLADEAVQQAFVKLLERPMPVDADARAWVFRVAVNEGLQLRRRQVRRSRLLDAFRALVPKRRRRAESPASDGPDDVDLARARRAIARLTPEQRRVLELRLDGHGFAEIAEIMGSSLGTAQTRMGSAARKLRDEFGDA